MKKLVMTFVLCITIFGTNFAQENNVYTVFVNVVNEQFRFPLIGFVNIAGGSHSSPQIGFVNWNQNDFAGLQLGFINTVGGNMGGFQMGFVNTTTDSFTGFQLGFVNTAVSGVNGVQLGFINYAESIEQGIPVGFLSIVKTGGYRAIELGVSEFSPFNVSFKIGVERLYTSFIVSYNPFGDDGIREHVMLGAGFGTIIRLNETFFINPEITSYNTISDDFQSYMSFVPYIGYTMRPGLSIVAGPIIGWFYTDNDTRFFYKMAS
jgi:hypothetical protein